MVTVAVIGVLLASFELTCSIVIIRRLRKQLAGVEQKLAEVLANSASESRNDG